MVQHKERTMSVIDFAKDAGEKLFGGRAAGDDGSSGRGHGERGQDEGRERRGRRRDHGGDANQYTKIFEANKPMLRDPNTIYPGQVLRIAQA